MQPYRVQILLPRAVVVHAPLLHARLRQWRDDVVRRFGSHDLSFAIPTDDLPIYANVFDARPDAFADELCDALIWSHAWEERWDEIAARCPASIVVSVTAQRPINYASMLLAFLAILDAVLSMLDEADRDAVVLHWIPARQLMTYARYRQLRIDFGPSGPAVNVRIANATGRLGELLADTIGLAELGLPDLQILFSDRDPAEIALRLRFLVRSMVVGDRLDCGWIEEASIVPPERDALTLQLDW
jgi:hypothetical protein